MKAKIAELEQQKNESDAETQLMVSALREDMLQQLKAKQSAIDAHEQRAARMLDWGVKALTSRNDAIILREAMATWRGVTFRQLGVQARNRKLKAFGRRLLQAQLLRAWNSWRESALELRAARAKAEMAVRKLMHRQTCASFLGWRVCTARSQPVCVSVCASERRQS